MRLWLVLALFLTLAAVSVQSSYDHRPGGHDMSDDRRKIEENDEQALDESESESASESESESDDDDDDDETSVRSADTRRRRRDASLTRTQSRRRRRSGRRRRSHRHSPKKGGRCHTGRKGRTQCGEYCLCIKSRWSCCRVRFEVSNLLSRKGGPQVLSRYMKVYARMTRHRKTQPRFKAIVEAHRTLFSSGIHDLPEFGAWHRWYLVQIENMVREHDCRVTIPYMDWGKVANTWQTSKLYSSNIMGGDGSAKHYNCVMDGPFKKPWETTKAATVSACKASIPEKYRCCLQRKFKKDNFHTIVYTEGNLKAPPHRYGEFLCILGMDIHVLGHDLPGGTMATDDSAQAPIFNLHHGYVDYQWWRYLRKSRAARASAKKFHDTHSKRAMPGTDSRKWPKVPGTIPGGFKASAKLDSTKLGKKKQICVTYEWDHEPLKKKLSKAQVEALSKRQQWAYLEDKLSHETLKEAMKTAHEQEPPWQTLKKGWTLFKTPKACWDRIEQIQKTVLKNLDPVGIAALNKDKDREDRKTGVSLEKALG